MFAVDEVVYAGEALGIIVAGCYLFDTNTHTCTHKHTHIYTYTHTHIHTQTYMHTHTNIHTHIHTELYYV